MKIGITGNIGTGKSTVVSILRDKGFPIVDTDIISREIINKKEIIDEILYKIDSNLLKEGEKEKRIDRKKLASVVFSDRKKLKLLNEILHPLILDEMRRQMTGYEKKYGIVLVDVPLLFEINLQNEFDKVLLVYASKELQLRRILQRDNRDKKEAENIINSQMNINEKVLLSDYIIYNEGTLGELQKNVLSIIDKIIENKDKNTIK